MLGKAVGNADVVLTTLGKKIDPAFLAAEFKYDGERTQLHWADGNLSMFSR